jgi:hypothetical protein
MNWCLPLDGADRELKDRLGAEPANEAGRRPRVEGWIVDVVVE